MLPLCIHLWTAAFDTHILAAFVGLPLRAPFHTFRIVADSREREAIARSRVAGDRPPLRPA